METRDKLIHAATAYDIRASKRRGYNHYALGQYFMAVDNVMEDYAKHGDIRRALVSNLNGRLLDACLKAVGQPTSTIQEQRY